MQMRGEEGGGRGGGRGEGDPYSAGLQLLTLREYQLEKKS